MKLLKNQATTIYSGVLDLSEQSPDEEKFNVFSHEVTSLSLCTRAIGGMVLEKIKNTETDGPVFLRACDEFAENITDINDTLIKIKHVIEQESHILN